MPRPTAGLAVEFTGTGLFYRLDYQTVPGVPVEHPLDQRAIVASNGSNLEVKLYGPSGKDIQENGVPGSGHGDGGYSDVGVIEVYGRPVPRTK